MLSGPSCPGANRSKVIGQSLEIELRVSLRVREGLGKDRETGNKDDESSAGQLSDHQMCSSISKGFFIFVAYL